MPESVKECCNNCAYERNSQCRRWPPSTTVTHHPRDGENEPDTVTNTSWPTIQSYPDSDYWCGEWKHPNDLINLVPDKSP